MANRLGLSSGLINISSISLIPEFNINTNKDPIAKAVQRQRDIINI